MCRCVAKIIIMTAIILSGCATKPPALGLVISEEVNAGFDITRQSASDNRAGVMLGYNKSQIIQMPVRFDEQNPQEISSVLVVYGSGSVSGGLPKYYATGALAEKLAKQNGARLVSEAVERNSTVGKN